jgi:hypothetical protein
MPEPGQQIGLQEQLHSITESGARIARLEQALMALGGVLAEPKAACLANCSHSSTGNTREEPGTKTIKCQRGNGFDPHLLARRDEFARLTNIGHLNVRGEAGPTALRRAAEDEPRSLAAQCRWAAPRLRGEAPPSIEIGPRPHACASFSSCV